MGHVETVCLRPVVAPSRRALAPLPVRVYAQEHNLRIHEAPDQKDWTDWTNSLQGFDVGVVVSFGRMIPGPLIRHFPRGMLNVHPSLLPRHRGASPLQYTVLRGDTHTGVCIMEVSEGKFDQGRILHTSHYTIPSPETITTPALSAALAPLGAAGLLQTLADLDARRAAAQLQSATGQKPTWARKITREMAHVDPQAHTALDISRTHRAIGDQFPLVFRVGTVDVRVTELTLGPAPDGSTAAQPGDAVYLPQTKTVAVRCAEGWIHCSRFTIPTKAPMDGAAFANTVQLRKQAVRFGKFPLPTA